MTNRILTVALAALTLAGWSGVAANSERPASTSGTAATDSQRILGPLAAVGEVESGLQFVARVDTGAKICSIHAEEMTVIDGSDDIHQNIGRTIRFRIVNRDGQATWLERTIADVSEIKTSEQSEQRYLVPMTLTCGGLTRQVLVSLNDRSQMSYAMLLGRNLLAGEFVVDVGTADVIRGS